MSQGYLRTFACENCGHQITLRAVGLTLTAGCPSCGTVIDVSRPQYRVLQEAQKNMSRPLIPLGTRGSLFGVLWEVIGYLERQDVSSGFTWSEYLLFNPYRGFCWLTHSDNHWSQVKPLKVQPLLSLAGSMELVHERETLKKYYQGQVVTTFVVGEFYWRLKSGDKVHMADYVLPPSMISCEQDGAESQWSVSNYLDRHLVESAFKIDTDAPSSIAPHQINPWLKKEKFIQKLFFVFIMLALLIQLVVVFGRPKKDVFHFSVPISHTNTPDGRFKTESFEIPWGTPNLRLELDSPVSQSWLALDVELVNESTDQTIPGVAEVEYYSGSDWAEGSRSTDILFSELKPGRYHLDMKASGSGGSSLFNPGETPLPASHPYTLRATTGVTNWSNFFWTCLVFGAFPVIASVARNNFETERWSESYYSNHASWVNMASNTFSDD